MKEKTNSKQIILFAGAFIAYSIGAAFSTGQEAMQFFSSYGYKGILGGIAFGLILFYTCWSYIHAGSENHFENAKEVFTYYCGKYIGTFFDWFIPIACYIIYIAMIAGAASTINEHFGLPIWVGGVLMTLAVLVTTIFGFKSIVDVIGKIGPFMVVCIFAVIIATLIKYGSGIPNSIALMESGKVSVMSAGSNWLTAAISYGGVTVVLNAMFITNLASKNNKKEVLWGVTIGIICVVLGAVGLAFALLTDIELAAASQIPALAMIAKLMPWFATVFSLAVVAGIYTTAVPLLWTPVSRFAKEKSTLYYVLCVVLAVVALVVVFFVPFGTIINITANSMNYVAFVLAIFMIVKDIRMALTKRSKG